MYGRRKFRSRRAIAAYNRKKAYGYLKSGYRFTKSALPMAMTALKIAKGVRSLINVEFKTVDSTISAANILTTGVCYCWSAMAEGTGDDERTGTSIKAKSLLLRFKLNFNSSGNPAQCIRCIMFIDQVCHGAAATTTEVLEASDIYSPLNLEYTKRFRVLKDQTFTLRGELDAVFRKWFFKFGHETKFIGNTANPADYGDGQIYLLILTDEPSINYPTVTMKGRFRYVDN